MTRSRAAQLSAALLGASLAAMLGIAAGPATATAAGTSGGPVTRPTATQGVDTQDKPTPRLQRRDRWLVDQYGRVVTLHGLNLVWKRAPYAPPDTAAGFIAADADFLDRYGFNAARVGMLWAGVTPRKAGVVDPAYFRRWDRVLDLLADRGIWSMFDAHQDMWHEQYGGEGYLTGLPSDRRCFTSVPGEENLGLSWHNYCPATFLASAGLPVGDVESCTDFSDGRVVNALDQARVMDAAPLMTEFGATDDVSALGIDAEVADSHQMGWTYWAYKRWDDPTTADTARGLFADDADLTSVKPEKLRTLVRSYPQAVAGTPISYHYDVATGRFDLEFRPDLAISEPTVVFVSPLTAPNGYRVETTNATVLRKDGSRVYLRARSAAVAAVTITPVPGPGN